MQLGRSGLARNFIAQPQSYVSSWTRPCGSLRLGWHLIRAI
jgi:hypothetical protein